MSPTKTKFYRNRYKKLINGLKKSDQDKVIKIARNLEESQLFCGTVDGEDWDETIWLYDYDEDLFEHDYECSPCVILWVGPRYDETSIRFSVESLIKSKIRGHTIQLEYTYHEGDEEIGGNVITLERFKLLPHKIS